MTKNNCFHARWKCLLDSPGGHLGVLGKYYLIRTPTRPQSQAARRTIWFVMPPIAVVVAVVCGLCAYARANAMSPNVSIGFPACFVVHICIRASKHAHV